jgi:DNA anti-recombination protein RmuC
MSVDTEGDRTALQTPAAQARMREVMAELERVLEVLGSQLLHSMQESAREWADVGAALDRLASANAQLQSLAEQQPPSTPIRTQSDAISASLAAAVVALQHHDRLAQRLGHIQSGIDDLRELLTDGVERSSTEWLVRLGAVEKLQRDEQDRLIAIESVSRGSVELF